MIPLSVLYEKPHAGVYATRMQQVDSYLQQLSANFFAQQLQYEQLEKTEPTELEAKLIKAIEKMQLATRIESQKQPNLASIYQESKRKLEARLEAMEDKIALYSQRIEQLENENRKLTKVLIAVFQE